MHKPLYASFVQPVNPRDPMSFATESHESPSSTEPPHVDETWSDRAGDLDEGPHPDAIEHPLLLRSTAKTLTKRESATATPTLEVELTPRDREILATLTRLRVLSYAQIQRRFFSGKSIEAVGQRMRKLAQRGLVSIWQEPVVRGGRPCYALPTAEGLKLGMDEVRASANGSPFERLVDLMLPKQPRQPLVLQPGIQPAFLAHQRECNHLALSFGEMAGARLLFVSTWERPMPNAVLTLPMPQPDLVMVFEVEGKARLVFGEHDRGHESLSHFNAAKVERYAELLVRPGLVKETFGFDSFGVWVTVLDKRFRRPTDRLQALCREVTKAGVEKLFSFALAGCAYRTPGEEIWSRNGDLLAPTSSPGL